jgi:hypothetical protein
MPRGGCRVRTRSGARVQRLVLAPKIAATSSHPTETRGLESTWTAVVEGPEVQKEPLYSTAQHSELTWRPAACIFRREADACNGRHHSPTQKFGAI